MVSDLTVRFEKGAAGWYRVEARRRNGKPFLVSMGGAGFPHDLVTFVVERELGLRGGFVNLTAHGATFRSSRRRFTRPGRALIAAHRAELNAAEKTVNAVAWAWKAGRPTPAGTALEEAERAWNALPVGSALELTWRTLPLPGHDRARAGAARAGAVRKPAAGGRLRPGSR